jgi:hypothetical protein
MTKSSQKEAVFNAVTHVLGVEFPDTGAVELSKEQRAQVNMILFEGFRAGTIELDREFTDTELKAYVSGLQSNWLRKDKRLNGGVQYVAKNPGSRTGVGDAQLKALRALLKTQVDPNKIAEIHSYIDKRVAELDAAKAKTVQVNVADLPAELRAKLGITE